MAFQELADQIRQLQRRQGELQGDQAAQSSALDYLADGLIELAGRMNTDAGRQPARVAVGIGASPGNAGSQAPVYWDAGFTVTLPAGRFTQVPVVQATAERSGHVLGVNIITRSTTSVTFRTIRFGGVVEAGTAVHWQATQMTESSAAG